MKYVTETKHVPLGFGEIAGGALDGQAVTLKGAVHSLRAMGGITFLALRVRDRAVQCVCRPEELPEGLCEECAAVVTGTVRRRNGPRGPGAGGGGGGGAPPRPPPPAAPPPKRGSRSPPGQGPPRAPPAPPSPPALQGGEEGRGGPSRIHRPGLHRDPHPQDRPRRGRGGQQHLPAGLLRAQGISGPVPQFYKQTMVGSFERVFEDRPRLPGGEALHPPAPE